MPATVCPRVAVDEGTAKKLTVQVATDTVFVTIFNRNHPLGSDSIVPVHRDELHTVPFDKSKFTYHIDIAAAQLNCT